MSTNMIADPGLIERLDRLQMRALVVGVVGLGPADWRHGPSGRHTFSHPIWLDFSTGWELAWDALVSRCSIIWWGARGDW